MTKVPTKFENCARKRSIVIVDIVLEIDVPAILTFDPLTKVNVPTKFEKYEPIASQDINQK